MSTIRLNKYLAGATLLSRRGADAAIDAGRVSVNGQLATLGSLIEPTDSVLLDDLPVTTTTATQTIMLHKPVGYICSRDGQGNPTIYELLPDAFQLLNPVGRLDKDTSGILLLTTDGELAHNLTHPSFEKKKIYHVTLKTALKPADIEQISSTGVELEDGLSQLGLKSLDESGRYWQVTMHEGRNRQIRRTFKALDYKITSLRRTQFGPYKLGNLAAGKTSIIPAQPA